MLQYILIFVVYIGEGPLIQQRKELAMDDDKIIDLYWDRSEVAISHTANKYGRYCHYISYNILYNVEDAEECVNDTYLGAWESMPPQRPNNLSTFLGKITRNLSLNRYKFYNAKKRGLGQIELVLSELDDCIPAPDNVAQATDEMILVESIDCFLYNQSDIKQKIFVRRYWYLHPIKNIAEQFEMTENKVTSMLFRMRNELRLYLEKEGIML